MKFRREEGTLGELEQLPTCTEQSNKSKKLRYIHLSTYVCIYVKFLRFIYVSKNIYKLFCSK